MPSRSPEIDLLDADPRMQAIRFGATGLANVGVDLGIYVGLIHLGLGITLAKSLAFICGILFAYSVNRIWTFKSNDTSLLTFGSIFLLYMISMVVNVSINSGIIGIFGTELQTKAVAYVAAVSASAVLNFTGMRLAFRKTPQSVFGESKGD